MSRDAVTRGPEAVARGLAAAGMLCGLLAALVVFDRTNIAASVYRSAAWHDADIVVFSLVAAAAIASLFSPHRRAILLAATLAGLPFALGIWSLVFVGYIAIAVALARTPIPLIARLALAFLAWLVVPLLRIYTLDVDGQAHTIFLALVWGGQLYAAFFLIVERERSMPDEKSTLLDDAFYLLAPPRLVAPFFQPISPRDIARLEKPTFPRGLVKRAAWLACYALILVVVAHQLSAHAKHLGWHPLVVAAQFVAAYSRFAYTIIVAIAVFRLLGFDLPPGFRFPFISRSFGEFFRRFNHYVRDAVLSLFYFPILGYLRLKLPKRAAAILSSYFGIIIGSLALHDLLVPVGISVHPLATLHGFLRPRRIIGMAILWTLIVVPTAGIAPRKEAPLPLWRVIVQIALVDAIYFALWYLGER